MSSEKMNLVGHGISTEFAELASNVNKINNEHALSKQHIALDESFSKLRIKSQPKLIQSSSRNTKMRENQLSLPLTPQVTLEYFRTLLSDYEQSEILLFNDIYFAGSATVEKIGTTKRRTGADLHGLFNLPGTKCDTDGSIYNKGYDDSRGDLYLTKHDHIGYRYEILSLLGKGSFGQVAKCYDHKLKVNVALKIIRNKTRFEKQGLVEVDVLNRLKSEDTDRRYNLVHVLDNFYFRGHLCFAFELLGINLYEWLQAGKFRGVHLGIVRRYSFQMLQCLSLLERLQIIHCDLKPENILLKDSRITRPSYLDVNMSNSKEFHSKIPSEFNENAPQYDIRVIDFGSSCYEKERLYTYVQSRFYRSPEIILGLPYTIAIDMWSFGCVVAEVFTGYPLFPGENEAEQLACIMEVKGIPDSAILSRGTRTKEFFDSARQPRALTNSKGKKRRPASKTLSSVLKCSDMAFIDFVERCLEWDAQKRMKPSEALKHPFITKSRFIPLPTSNNLENKQPTPIVEKNSTKSLVRNKYASTVNMQIARKPVDSEPKSTLRNKISVGSLKNRLPSVASFSKFGEQIASKVDRKRYSEKNTLPPILNQTRSTYGRVGNLKTSGYLNGQDPNMPTWK